MPATKSKRLSVKAQALRLVRGLPSSASWDEVMYPIYVRQKIESGLADVRAGRLHGHASIKKEFGLA